MPRCYSYTGEADTGEAEMDRPIQEVRRSGGKSDISTPNGGHAVLYAHNRSFKGSLPISVSLALVWR